MTCRWCGAGFTPASKARGQVFCTRRCVEQERNQRVRQCACGWRFSAMSRHTTVCPWCRAGKAEGPLPVIGKGGSCRVRKPKAVKYVHRGTLPRPCAQCGIDMAPVGKYQHAICQACKDATKKRNHRLSKARRKGRIVGGVPYRPADIFERDGHRCHLCGGKVGMQPVPHPKAATIDHLVPLCDGGSDEPRNVATAHFLCNSRRGARGAAQLRLVA